MGGGTWLPRSISTTLGNGMNFNRELDSAESASDGFEAGLFDGQTSGEN